MECHCEERSDEHLMISNLDRHACLPKRLPAQNNELKQALRRAGMLPLVARNDNLKAFIEVV